LADNGYLRKLDSATGMPLWQQTSSGFNEAIVADSGDPAVAGWLFNVVQHQDTSDTPGKGDRELPAAPWALDATSFASFSGSKQASIAAFGSSSLKLTTVRPSSAR
jgi:hypothetical protein